MTGIITLSRLINMISNETINKYTRSLSENLINLTFISQYLNFLDKYKSGVRSNHLPVIPLDFDLDLNLQSFFLYLQTLQLNLILLNKTSEFFRAFCKRIHKNQLHRNKCSIQQYRKQ